MYVILEWHILENLAPQVLAPLVLSDLMQIDIKSGVIKENRLEYWYTLILKKKNWIMPCLRDLKVHANVLI